MEEILNKAKALCLSNDLFDTISMLLYDMEEADFEELQFKVALKLDDKKLLIKRLLQKKKREIMKVTNPKEVLSVEKCPIIQDPSTWAKKSFLSDIFSNTSEREKSYLKWINTHIHKPLTKITDKKNIDDVITNFRNIRCFIGDKPHSNPVSCAQSVIHLGIHHEFLRDEIYLQLVKLLTENPNPKSVAKGWELMAYCLQAFSPIITQKYIEYFIWNNSPYSEALLTLMYFKMMFEPTNIMQVNEIRLMLSEGIKLEEMPKVSNYIPNYSPRTDPQLLTISAEVLRQLNIARYSIKMQMKNINRV